MDPNYQYQQDPNMYPQKRTNGMAIASLVVGIIGIFIFQFILGPLAIIFGGVGMGFANRNNGSGKGLAIAGLVLGIIALLLFIVVMAMWSSVKRF
jgi:hypothetical protein